MLCCSLWTSTLLSKLLFNVNYYCSVWTIVHCELLLFSMNCCSQWATTLLFCLNCCSLWTTTVLFCVNCCSLRATTILPEPFTVNCFCSTSTVIHCELLLFCMKCSLWTLLCCMNHSSLRTASVQLDLLFTTNYYCSAWPIIHCSAWPTIYFFIYSSREKVCPNHGSLG